MTIQKSITFAGDDKPDLDRQIWNWRSVNSHFRVTKIHPIKYMPTRMHAPDLQLDRKKLQARILVRVDYELSH